MEILCHKYSQDFVDVVDGRVMQCCLIISRLVPLVGEWKRDEMKNWYLYKKEVHDTLNNMYKNNTCHI